MGQQADPGQCSEAECEESATVRLYVPWDENRLVCAAHARALGQQDGVVASPLESTADEWP